MNAFHPAEAPGVADLFDGMPGADSIIRAALDGMGTVAAEDRHPPRYAFARCGDFVYCAGTPDCNADALLAQVLGGRQGGLLVYAPGDWSARLSKLVSTHRVTRWAFDHRVQPEDDHLRRLLGFVPDGMRFQPIEGEWIAWCLKDEWSRDFVSLFSEEAYASRGLGVLLMDGDEPVAGASSYVSYTGGIEVQLQTRDDRQGRGYATLAAAKLILTAHERGLIATWDAANEASVHIAQKLGYRLTGAYTVEETEESC